MVSGGQFVIDAEAAAGSQTANAATSYPANIPVQAGEILGISDNGGTCISMDSGYAVTGFNGDVPPSSTPLTPAGPAAPNFALPVQATVTAPTPPTGQRAAALKKCKKKAKKKGWTKKRLKRCKQKATLLPL